MSVRRLSPRRVLFAWREQLVLFSLLVTAVYWCYGTQLSVFASTTADFYGTRNLEMNYGPAVHGFGHGRHSRPDDRGASVRRFG